MFNFTNGPFPVEKIGVDEFPLLGKDAWRQNKSMNKDPKPKFLVI